MKLVDILARELKVWPNALVGGGPAKAVAQDASGELNTLDSNCKASREDYLGGAWSGAYWTLTDDKYTLAYDHPQAIVTREQWQAAADALSRQSPDEIRDAWQAGHVINSTQQWDGKGLPPVGTDCQVMMVGLPSQAFDWEECTILLINEGENGKPQVCTRDFRGDLAIYYPGTDSVYFRPIRTAEQIASEERASAIEDLIKVTCITHSEAGRIYDAGYRKVQP